MAKQPKKASTESSVMCADCGVEMNMHAAKIVEPRNAGEAARMNPTLGGMIADVYCCPECGRSKSLRHP